MIVVKNSPEGESLGNLVDSPLAEDIVVPELFPTPILPECLFAEVESNPESFIRLEGYAKLINIRPAQERIVGIIVDAFTCLEKNPEGKPLDEAVLTVYFQ